MEGRSPQNRAIKSGPVLHRVLLQGVLIAAVLVILMISRGQAHGGDTDECDVLGGTVVAGQCQIAVPVNATSPAHGGSFDIAQDLHILGTGRIDATGPTGGATGGITLNIAGDLIIDAPTVANGGQIEANDPATPTNSASPITINATGELSMAAGSVISASDTTAGGSAAPISLDFGGGFDSAGTIAAENPSSGTPIGDGASIDIAADGDFRLRDTGLISTNESAGNGSAAPIDVTVGGAMRMDAGSRIRAENTNQAGDGGAITVDVAGDMTMKGAASPAAGASISSSDTAGNGNASPTDVTVGGEMTMEAGSRILAENATGGNGGAITIDVAGNMTMGGAAPAAGAIISSSSTGGGTNNGGNITIDVGDCDATPPTGDLVIEPGAQVKANAQTASAGEIDINACHNMEMDGLVESASNQTGTSSTARGGGPIDLVAGCVLNISDEGKVSSRSLDPRGDRVHLEGCEVNVFGIVESVARGHANPDEANGCKGPDRPDKPNGVPLANYPYAVHSTNCVEIWGQNILIDSTGTHNGEVSADSGGGGNGGTGWIDLYAQKNLTIAGNAGSPYAVHADGMGGSGTDGEEGGLITAKAQTGTLTASGLAFTAFAGDQGSNSDGGTIVLESNLDLNLDGATADSGGADLGGRISGRSFNGSVLGTAGGVLDTCGAVRGAETGVQDNVCSVTFAGSVTLQGCGPDLLPGPPNDGVSYAGTTQPTFTQPDDVCGGAPGIAAYVVFDTTMWARCDPKGKIELVKELDPASDPGLFDLLIAQGATNIDTEPDATDGGTTGENEASRPAPMRSPSRPARSAPSATTKSRSPAAPKTAPDRSSPRPRPAMTPARSRWRSASATTSSAPSPTFARRARSSS